MEPPQLRFPHLHRVQRLRFSHNERVQKPFAASFSPYVSRLTTHAYRITLSARASTFGGIVRPICLAALRLTMNSNFFGCSTGRSAGLTPFKILSTYVAARRNKSGVFAP